MTGHRNEKSLEAYDLMLSPKQEIRREKKLIRREKKDEQIQLQHKSCSKNFSFGIDIFQIL